MAAVRKISVFSHSHTVGGASMNVMLTLYNSCVRSYLQCIYAAWCWAKNVNKLEGVQNRCGVMKNSITEVMQALCRVPPLKLRLEAYLISTFVKILRQPDTSPIKSIVLAQLANFGSSKYISSTQYFVWQQTNISNTISLTILSYCTSKL